jgi:hypothetical protein
MISLVELAVVAILIGTIIFAVKYDKKIQRSGKDFPTHVKRSYK